MKTIKNLSRFGIIDALLAITFLGLVIAMLFNGTTLLMGDSTTIAKYLQFYAGKPLLTSEPSSVYIVTLKAMALLQLLSGLLLLIGIGKAVIDNKSNEGAFIRYGLFLALLSILLYSFVARFLSNNDAAASHFFYVGLLYLVLHIYEQRFRNHLPTFERIKLIPLFLAFISGLGIPGINKLINMGTVLPGFEAMFAGTFLVQAPGGIAPFMYLLASLEFIVGLLILASLLRGEFLPDRKKRLFSWALLIGGTTFVMLSFGLTILVNFPGATNLVFYTIFTLWLYYYATLCPSIG